MHPKQRRSQLATEQCDAPEDLQFLGKPTTSSHRAGSPACCPAAGLSGGSCARSIQGGSALEDGPIISLAGNLFLGRKQTKF